ncbi:unnamed protein product [Laminaria digitata]
MAGGKFGGDWWDGVFRGLAVVLSKVGVAPSTNATCSAAWKMWVKWRQDVVKRSAYLDVELGEELVAEEISKYLAYMYFSRGNKISTVDGKLTAIQYFHRRVGIDLPMKNHFIKSVKAGIAREGALKGEAPRIRRPISWVMLKQGFHLAKGRGDGGRVLWLTLGVTYFFFV